ncbi:MAG: adenylosuccinate lyase [Nanoarchaeota archaeon]
MHELEAISPVDGRYRKITEPLSEMFSEKGLIGYRLRVEGEYLISLSEHPGVGTRDFSDGEKSLIRNLYHFSLEDAIAVKEIEKQTNHDVKAVEYFMKNKLKATSLEDSLEWIHFALTSEDVNNLAYGLMLSDGIGNIVLPVIENLRGEIEELADKYKSTPMLARTYGQPASPTTFGKEFKVFSSRLERQTSQIKNFEILAKLNGAVGNYNAHHVAYPEIDWLGFTREFINRLNGERKIKLKPNFVTTQIEPHDNYAELFDSFGRLNNILIDFAQDMWRYVSDGWIVQKPVESEVGSSTMPHKVNPIDFENSEGNFGLANSLFEFFSRNLPISRLQRHLSDSTIARNFGSALAYSFIGYNSVLRGLSKISVNEKKVTEELEKHPEIIAEAIQTILRREGVETPYEKLKELTRGREVTFDDLKKFIGGLNISEDIKDELRGITPLNYIGIADKIVEID